MWFEPHDPYGWVRDDDMDGCGLRDDDMDHLLRDDDMDGCGLRDDIIMGVV